MNTFSKETFEFLVENHFRNDREWFRAHKGEYTEYVLEPFQALVAALSPTMLEIDGHLITEPKVDKTVSRIYRDTRFSKDKSLYKDHMWCVFSRDKKQLYFGPACYFFEITPDFFHYGCGYYQASSGEMAAIRELMLERHASFEALRRLMEGQAYFEVQGESYKRNRYSEQPEELQPWLNRKNLFFAHRSTDFEKLYAPDLAVQVAADFRRLAPAYQFFLAAHARMQR